MKKGEKEEKVWTVYIHTVPKKITGYDNNKHYVGITSRNPEERWRNGNGYNPYGYYISYFWNAIQKYGWENIEHKIVYTNLTQEEANRMEQLLIFSLKSNNIQYGYNIQKGGQSGKMTEEIKYKISKANTNKIINEETKKRISEALKGRFLSKEHIQNRTISQTGLKRRDETCKKISKSVSRSVVCLNTKIKYAALTEASLVYNINVSHLSQCCNKKRRSCGIDCENNKLYWMWLDEYEQIQGDNLSLIELLSYCKINKKSGNIKKQVRCKNTNEIFETIQQASNITKVNRVSISNCCNGFQQSAGKDADGNKLYWEFVD